MTTKQEPRPAEDRVAEDRYRAPALDKGLDILELLSDQSAGLTRTEIVKAMGRSPSEIYRMLERLVARGYVARSEGGDRYALTMKMLVLANRHPPVRRLVAQAQPLMDEFARRASQSCHLVVPDHGAAVVIAQASPLDSWEFRVRVGASLDLLDTGSGRALLAFQNPERRADTLAIWRSAAQAARLHQIEAELAMVRAQGYRLAESGQLIGVQDITVPLLASDGDAIAVLTCAYIGRPAPHAGDTIAQTLARMQALAGALSLS